MTNKSQMELGLVTKPAYRPGLRRQRRLPGARWWFSQMRLAVATAPEWVAIVAKKTDETRRRWDVAIKDRNFDCIRRLPVAETRPEHFDRALADGKVSTNV